MTINWNHEWSKYITESFDKENFETILTVKISDTPKELLNEMRSIDETYFSAMGEHYFTFVA